MTRIMGSAEQQDRGHLDRSIAVCTQYGVNKDRIPGNLCWSTGSQVHVGTPNVVMADAIFRSKQPIFDISSRRRLNDQHGLPRAPGCPWRSVRNPSMCGPRPRECYVMVLPGMYKAGRAAPASNKKKPSTAKDNTAPRCPLPFPLPQSSSMSLIAYC